MRRVVITGLGVFSSIGIGAEQFLDGLRAGRSNVKPITAFDTEGFAYAQGCEVDGFQPAQWIRNIPVAGLGRASQFAAAAARMAMTDAGLDEAALQRQRGLISIGTTDGEAHDLDCLAQAGLELGPQGMDPVLARRVSAARLSTSVARELLLADVEAATIATACSAGNYSIGSGFDAVSVGDVDFALCGGVDVSCRKIFTCFYRLGTIAPDYCRPFDKNRQGILTGEGVGVMMLEPLESALARGARIYAEVLGYGLNCDAFHPVAPNQASIARCMRLALRNAGVKASEVDLISAHGTGTKVNDVTESRAIREIYGNIPPRTISLKSMLGHTMGAASALAAIACSLAISHAFIPPTINHIETDPECEIDCVPNKSVPADLKIVQNNGLAFEGNNAVTIFGKYVSK